MRSSPCAMGQQTFESVLPFLDPASLTRLELANRLSQSEFKRAFPVTAKEFKDRAIEKIMDKTRKFVYRMDAKDNPLNQLDQPLFNLAMNYMMSHDEFFGPFQFNIEFTNWLTTTPQARNWINSFYPIDSNAKQRAFRIVYAMFERGGDDLKPNASLVLVDILRHAKPGDYRWEYVVDRIINLRPLKEFLQRPDTLEYILNYFLENKHFESLLTIKELAPPELVEGTGLDRAILQERERFKRFSSNYSINV